MPGPVIGEHGTPTPVVRRTAQRVVTREYALAVRCSARTAAASLRSDTMCRAMASGTAIVATNASGSRPSGSVDGVTSMAWYGPSPDRYVRRVRVEASAQLLASTALPMPRIAARCGFGSAETLRQAFVARYGISPSLYRATQVARVAS